MNKVIKFANWKFRLRASRYGGPALLVALLLGARPVSAQTPAPPPPPPSPREGIPTLSGYMEMHLLATEDSEDTEIHVQNAREPRSSLTTFNRN